MKIKRLFIFLLFFLQFTLFSDEKEYIQTDVEIIKDVDELFFFFYPNLSCKDLKGLNQTAIETLKNTGKVIVKHFDVQNPLNESKCPSMFYYLEELKDIDGLSLDVFNAKLLVKTGVILEKNKEYTKSTIWESSCFIKKSDKKRYSQLVSKSLGYLLKQYIADLSSLDGKKTGSMIFYYAE